MKTAIFAAAIAATSATAASADMFGVTVLGNAEYALEAETIETNIGAEVMVFDAIALTPLVTFTGNTDGFDFAGVELNASYRVTGNVSVYGKIEADKDFEYNDATLGVSFAF